MDEDMKSLSPEEAIAILSDMKIDIPVPKAAVTQRKRNVALDMAISALQPAEADVQKMQDLEQAEIQKAYELGKLDAMPHWIPCSERLPDIKEHHVSEPCIVYCSNGAYAFAELLENIFGQVGWDCERDDEYHEAVGEVVAWMPLPKPYAGKGGDTNEPDKQTD